MSVQISDGFVTVASSPGDAPGGMIAAGPGAAPLSIAIWSLRPAANSLWGIGIVAIFLHCLVDYPIQRPALGGFFFVLLGALAAQANESAQRNDVTGAV